NISFSKSSSFIVISHPKIMCLTVGPFTRYRRVSGDTAGFVSPHLQARQRNPPGAGLRSLSMSQPAHEYRVGGLSARKPVEHDSQAMRLPVRGAYLRKGKFLSHISAENQGCDLGLHLQAQLRRGKP